MAASFIAQKVVIITLSRCRSFLLTQLFFEKRKKVLINFVFTLGIMCQLTIGSYVSVRSSHFISWDGWLYKGPGRVRFQWEVEVLFDSRISCTWHVFVSSYFRHLCLVLDGFRLFAIGCRCFWGGCRWLLKFLRWLLVVLGGFRWFHVLILM